MQAVVYKKDLIHPQLSYKIVGALFEVFKQLGSGLEEKHYQRAVAAELKRIGLSFREQVYLSLKYKEEKIGSYYLDFLIENQVVLELKKNSGTSKQNIDQVNDYLQAYGLSLGIIANFTREGVRFKRIVNIYD